MYIPMVEQVILIFPHIDAHSNVEKSTAIYGRYYLNSQFLQSIKAGELDEAQPIFPWEYELRVRSFSSKLLYKLKYNLILYLVLHPLFLSALATFIWFHDGLVNCHWSTLAVSGSYFMGVDILCRGMQQKSRVMETWDTYHPGASYLLGGSGHGGQPPRRGAEDLDNPCSGIAAPAAYDPTPSGDHKMDHKSKTSQIGSGSHKRKAQVTFP
jgi:hypothetical protein